MKAIDFSKEIFEKYYGIASPLIVITLRDKTELTGKLTGFFRGEEEFDESYIIKWRFVNEHKLKEVAYFSYPNQDVGSIIRQQDIEYIRFK